MKISSKILFPLILISIVLLYISLVNEHWNPEWDSAFFIELAQSLLSSKGFTYLGHPEVKFGVGLSLLLSPIEWLWGNNFLLMNILIVLCALGAIWATYRLFRQFFTKEYAVLIAALTAISYRMVDTTTFIMSDIPYMLFSLIALIFISHYLRSERIYKHGIVASLFIIISFFMRSVGVSLIIMLVIYFCLKKNVAFRTKKALLILPIVIIPIVAWNVRNQRVKFDPNDPLMQLEEFVPVIHQQLRVDMFDPLSGRVTPRTMLYRVPISTTYHAGIAASLILGQRFSIDLEDIKTFPRPLHYLPLLFIFGIIALITTVGFIRSFISQKYLFDFYVLSYLGIYVLTTYREPRYMVPIFPFIVHYFISGLKWTCKKVRPLKITKFYISVSVLFIIFYTCSNLVSDAKIIINQHRTPFYSEYTENLMNTIDWVKHNTPEDSKIVSVVAPWIVFLAERWCVSFPWVSDQHMIMDYFSRVGAEYLIVGPAPHLKYRYLVPLIDDNPRLFQELYSKGMAKVYKINRDLLDKKLGKN